jgi:hypothetical protein
MSVPLTDTELMGALAELQAAGVLETAGCNKHRAQLWRVDAKALRAVHEKLEAIDTEKQWNGVEQCESCGRQADDETRDKENWGFNPEDGIYLCPPCLGDPDPDEVVA